jgi:hypothetical protein
MIVKNAKLGETENVMVCVLGTGDVWMLGSKKGENGEVILAMKTIDEPKPIGAHLEPSVETFDEMEPELAFIFNKVESIDSLIAMLEDCKITMLDKDE